MRRQRFLFFLPIKIIFPAVIIMIFITVPTVYASEKDEEKVPCMVCERLNLTQEQINELRKIRKRYFNELQNLRKEIFQKRIELKNLYLDKNVNEMAILNKQKELMELRQKLEEKRMNLMLEERKILTPEQVEMLNRLPREKRNRMGHGMGRLKRNPDTSDN